MLLLQLLLLCCLFGGDRGNRGDRGVGASRVGARRVGADGVASGGLLHVVGVLGRRGADGLHRDGTSSGSGGLLGGVATGGGGRGLARHTVKALLAVGVDGEAVDDDCDGEEEAVDVSVRA